MKHALNFGPISVLVQAGNKAWQFQANINEIGNDVLNDPDCGKEIDHAVLAVGYGTNPDGQEYFLVKNSRLFVILMFAVTFNSAAMDLIYPYLHVEIEKKGISN